MRVRVFTRITRTPDPAYIVADLTDSVPASKKPCVSFGMVILKLRLLYTPVASMMAASHDKSSARPCPLVQLKRDP